jgi:hypothetical protein
MATTAGACWPPIRAYGYAGSTPSRGRVVQSCRPAPTAPETGHEVARRIYLGRGGALLPERQHLAPNGHSDDSPLDNQGPTMPPSSTADRVLRALRRLSDQLSGFPSERTQRLLLLGAVPLLVVGAFWSYRQSDLTLQDLRLVPLVVAATVGLLLVISVNAWEYRLTGRAVGQRITTRSSLEIAVLSTVLNYLPGHGGALLRIQTLHRDGSAYRHAGAATLAAGLMWLGVAAATPGIWLLATGRIEFGGILLLGGVTALATAGFALGKAVQGIRWMRLCSALLVVEIASVFALAFRYYLLLLAIGHAESPALGAAVLAFASVLAAATGVMPGGLGIRELLASVFGPLVGLPITLAFLIATLDRVLGLSGHAVAAIPLLRSRRGNIREAHSGATEADA